MGSVVFSSVIECEGMSLNLKNGIQQRAIAQYK